MEGIKRWRHGVDKGRKKSAVSNANGGEGYREGKECRERPREGRN